MRRVHARVLTITRQKQEVSIKSLRVAIVRERLITHHSWNSPYRWCENYCNRSRDRKRAVKCHTFGKLFLQWKEFHTEGRERLIYVKRECLLLNIYTPLKLFMKLKTNVLTLNGAFLSLLTGINKKLSGKIIVFAYEDFIFEPCEVATALPRLQEIDFTVSCAE